MLFDDDQVTIDGFGDALRSAEINPDSRGTANCAVALFCWSCGGIDVRVEQKDRCDTAALVWKSSLRICAYLHDSGVPSQTLGCVCDLGAGTGLLGLWTALAGLATRVVLADRPSWLPYLEKNIVLNGFPTGGLVTSCGAVWGASAGRFDTVLASDLLYDASQHSALLATLCDMRPTRLILSFAVRDTTAESTFLDALGETFNCKLVAPSTHILTPLHSDDQEHEVQVWECGLRTDKRQSDARY